MESPSTPSTDHEPADTPMESMIPAATEPMTTAETQVKVKLCEDGKVDEGSTTKVKQGRRCDFCEFHGENSKETTIHQRNTGPLFINKKYP